MNEEKCIEFIKERFNGREFELMSVEERRRLHKECEEFCAQQGISGIQFDMLWNQAMFRIKAGI